MKVSMRISQFAQGAILTLLLATVLVVPLLFSPNMGAWRGVKPIVFEMLALALVGLALMQATLPRSRRPILEFLGTGPNLPILLLVLYGAWSWSRSPEPALSSVEWLRLACGAGLYMVVATALRGRDQIRSVVDVLMAVAILTSLYGFVAYGQPDAMNMSSSFGNRQLFAGFLLMLVPLLLVLSFSELDPKRKIAAQVAAVLAVSSLLMAQTRSSWLGAIVALVALGVMALRQAGPGTSFTRHKHQMVLPLLIVVGALTLFLGVSRTAPMLKARASTLAAPSADGSFAWRQSMWQGGWKLFLMQPLTGWGIGTFPVEYSRLVPNATPRELVKHSGPTLADQAHNEYLQMAAELGVVGLGLHLWILGAFFVYGIRALRQREQGLRKLVLMGCLAGLAGQAVDALSNPAWRFADVSFLFWLMMGLGVASARLPRRSQEQSPAAAVIPWGMGRLGWQGAALGLTVFAMGGAWTCPGGQNPLAVYVIPLELRLEPTTATLRPGQCVEFRLFARSPQAVAANPRARFVDVTDEGNIQWEVETPRGRFCLRNNIQVDRELAPASNVFCVPTGACTSPLLCGGGRTVTVVATFLQQSTAQVRATVTVACP